MQKKVKIALKKNGRTKKKTRENGHEKKMPIFFKGILKKKEGISPFFENQIFGPLLPIQPIVEPVG